MQEVWKENEKNRDPDVSRCGVVLQTQVSEMGHYNISDATEERIRNYLRSRGIQVWQLTKGQPSGLKFTMNDVIGHMLKELGF